MEVFLGLIILLQLLTIGLIIAFVLATPPQGVPITSEKTVLGAKATALRTAFGSYIIRDKHKPKVNDDESAWMAEQDERRLGKDHNR